MNHRLAKLTVSLLLTVSMGMGCIGNFALSAKVREFNLERTQDRWEREGLFVCLYLIPVYPFAGAADLLVLNSIEFWTGINPVDQSKSVSPIAATEWTTEDGTKVTMQGKPDNSIDVTLVAASGDRRYLNLTQNEEGITARDEAGNILVRSADFPIDEIERHL